MIVHATSGRALCCALLALALVAPAPAVAQELERVRVSASAVGGSMISEDQLGWLGFDRVGVGGVLGFGYSLTELLVPEVHVGGTYFLSDARGGGAIAELGAGLRISLGTPVNDIFVEPAAHVNVAWTGDLLLPSVDIGVRIAVRLGDSFSAGPEAFYGQVFWKNDTGYSTDARFLMAGASVVWRPGGAAEAERMRTRIIEREHLIGIPVERVVRTSAPPAPPPPAPGPSVEIERLLEDALPIQRREERQLIAPVLFEFDSTRVIPCGEVALYAAREAILEMRDTVIIEGHADGTGTDGYNVNLSLARATWVHDWLVAHGIDASRLRVEAHGETRPLARETDDSIRQLDRRVIFRTVHVEPAAEAPAP